MNATLKRELGVPGAVALGLGSMVGTGVFVAIGLGAGVAGSGVLVAIVLAGGLAFCNAMSSAQLAAAHPVAGGTYEYGHRFLTPALGAVAGVTFLVAKSASAATAALGLSAYGLSVLPVDFGGGGDWVRHFALARLAVALLVLLGGMVIVLEGIRRSTRVNTAIVVVTLVSLLVFVGSAAVYGPSYHERVVPVGTGYVPEGTALTEDAGWPSLDARSAWREPGALLMATALMFVAYTGYGRVATCAEEVREPARTIPRAVVATVAVTLVLYVVVAAAMLWAVGLSRLPRLSYVGSPLWAIARVLDVPAPLRAFIAVGAITAMLGVLLNLVLGLSRVALAMGRRRHLPGVFAKVDEAGTTPAPAVLLVTAVIAGLIVLGSIRHAWSLSAVTVLIYYGLTNAAALRLPAEHRRYPRALAWVGLLGCFGLSLMLEPAYVLTGFGFVVAALGLHAATSTARASASAT
ncbi:MAG: APC family permease [Planctomycetota bacterium]